LTFQTYKTPIFSPFSHRFSIDFPMKNFPSPKKSPSAESRSPVARRGRWPPRGPRALPGAPCLEAALAAAGVGGAHGLGATGPWKNHRNTIGNHRKT
jgi:hypothetical protein